MLGRKCWPGSLGLPQQGALPVGARWALMAEFILSRAQAWLVRLTGQGRAGAGGRVLDGDGSSVMSLFSRVLTGPEDLCTSG